MQTNKGYNYQEKLKCILLANILHFHFIKLMQHVHYTSCMVKNTEIEHLLHEIWTFDYMRDEGIETR